MLHLYWVCLAGDSMNFRATLGLRELIRRMRFSLNGPPYLLDPFSQSNGPQLDEGFEEELVKGKENIGLRAFPTGFTTHVLRRLSGTQNKNSKQCFFQKKIFEVFFARY